MKNVAHASACRRGLQPTIPDGELKLAAAR